MANAQLLYTDLISFLALTAQDAGCAERAAAAWRTRSLVSVAPATPVLCSPTCITRRWRSLFRILTRVSCRT